MQFELHCHATLEIAFGTKTLFWGKTTDTQVTVDVTPKAVVEEFISRSKMNLCDRVEQTQKAMAKILAQKDAARHSHEQRLTPSLANPNHAAALLVEN